MMDANALHFLPVYLVTLSIGLGVGAVVLGFIMLAARIVEAR
jgi:hypothetical protein